jgi:hypothetical protein
MKGKAGVMGLGVLIASLMMLSSMGLTHITFVASGAGGRAVYNEMTDTDAVNNDDFTTAQVIETMVPGDYLAGTTGLGDTHRIDTYVIKNVAAGMVINASIRITNWNTGDYFIQLKPIAGVGTFQYELNARVFDPEDITSKIGAGGVFGPAIPGRVSSLKWYPGNWYKFQMAGEVNGMNEYLYVNVTEPGAPDQRLQGDPYVRNLEPESYSYWLNHSWWLDSYVQYEEMRAAATHEGMAWYYLDMQGYNTTGGRSENYEIRLSKTVIDSDGDNHPKIATKVTYELGKTTVRKTGMVVRGPDMMDWYQPDPQREIQRHLQAVDIPRQHHGHHAQQGLRPDELLDQQARRRGAQPRQRADDQCHPGGLVLHCGDSPDRVDIQCQQPGRLDGLHRLGPVQPGHHPARQDGAPGDPEPAQPDSDARGRDGHDAQAELHRKQQRCLL